MMTDPIVENQPKLAGAAILAAILGMLVFGLADARPRQTPPRQDECARLLGKIKELQAERTAILERKPPFDKMDIKDVEANLAHRDKEINLAKSRRFLLECPGAEKVVAGGGGTTAGGGATEGRPGGGSGKAPRTIQEAGITLKAYAGTIPGAVYREDDPQTCSLPGEAPVLEVGTPSVMRFKPGSLSEAEFTSEIPLNGLKVRAGSVGEDMQGYWGAVIAWNQNGLTYSVSMTVAYPEVKDNTPERRQELYRKCLDLALKAAVPYDKAMRGLK